MKNPDNSWHNYVVVLMQWSNYCCITLEQGHYLRHLLKSKQSNYINICIVLRFVNILKIWFQYKLCYCLIILVLHWKTLISDFWQRLVLCKKKKQFLLFKKRRLLGAPTKVGFTIFPWNFALVLYVAMAKNLCLDFFCFVVLFSKIYQFRKKKIFLNTFLSVLLRRTHAQNVREK